MLKQSLPSFLRFFLPLLLAACALPFSASAQVDGAGSTSTNFQKIGMGARGVAMGEAFASVADDATAVFWNPAGLILAKGTQFSLTHGEWMVGVTHEFFAFSQNIDRDGAFGMSLGYLGTGEFPSALEIPGQPIQSSYGGVGPNISASDYVGTLAYAQRLGNWFGGDFFQRSFLGVEATLVGQNVVNVGNTGLAFNAGYMYEISKKQFYVGAVVYNVGTQFPATVVSNGVTAVQDFSQPIIYKFGGNYQAHSLLMKKDRNILALETDGHIDTGMKFDIGDEYRMKFGRNSASLRVGYRTGSDLGAVAGLTSGVGVSHRFDDFEASLDYAFVPYGVLGDSHRVSLNVVIGGPLTIPEAYVNAPPSFVLDQQNLKVSFATKSEEPIAGYKATLLDPNGNVVKTFSGKGAPPANFLWDGRGPDGKLVPEGHYTWNLEVTDEEDTTGKSRPRDVYAKWMPKKVPYQYNFQVPGDLLFDSGKDELLKSGYSAIEKAVAAIRARYPESMILVAGHTDNVGLNKGARFKDNQQLSLARAQAVMNYLVKSGMSPQKLSVIGYGDSKPIASNKTAEGRAKNRRVELVVTGVREAGPQEMIDEGQAMMKEQRTREALERFLKAIEADARNAKAYHLAGDCYLLLGGKDEAANAYRKALEYNPNDTSLKQWLDQYAPAPKAPAAPAAPAAKPSTAAPAPPAAKPAPAAPASSSGAPVPAAPAAPANASPAAPSGMPVPVEGQ